MQHSSAMYYPTVASEGRDRTRPHVTVAGGVGVTIAQVRHVGNRGNGFAALRRPRAS